MNIIGWFTDPAHWTGSGSIPMQVGYHLLYSAIALLVALAIGVPLGILIGYTGRGETLVAGLANALRALPSLGLLVLLFLIFAPIVSGKLVYILPTIVVLVLLAVPPILTGTYAGIQNADPDAVGAARGIGFTKRQILLHVQLPCALPLLISGIRSSTLQIVSTATIAAYLGLQGLGRFILDGRAQAVEDGAVYRLRPAQGFRGHARVRVRQGPKNDGERARAPRRLQERPTKH